MDQEVIASLDRVFQISGINRGDTVLIHSSLRGTMRRYHRQGKKITPEEVLQSFREAVGPRGTLLFPLFNFDFAQSIRFDMRTTPSKMGQLTEAARLHPEAVRTGHPIYSFAVIGAQAAQFKDIDNFSGYGADSPFAKLREMKGRIAVLDLPDQNSMTYYHHVEEMHSVAYRYHKSFTGEYVDLAGRELRRTYGLFVRNLEMGIRTHVDPMGEELWRLGLYKGDRPGTGSGLRIIDAREMFDAVSEVIKSGTAEGKLFRVEGSESAD